MQYEEKIQLLIIGDSTVGKTSILNRYTKGEFNPNYLATLGIDFFKKDEILNGKTIRIKIWDTAGEERYKSLTQGYFRNAEGIIIVYDVSNKDTFDNLKFWIQSIKTHINIDKQNIPSIIIGNKIDLPEREVSKDEGKNFAREEKMEYFETSAKSGDGIDESIKCLAYKVINKSNNNSKDKKEKNLEIKIDVNDDGKKKDKCCNI